MEDGIEENRAEDEKEHDDSEPKKDKAPLVLLRRRRGDADDVRQTAKQTGQKFDHWFSENPMPLPALPQSTRAMVAQFDVTTGRVDAFYRSWRRPLDASKLRVSEALVGTKGWCGGDCGRGFAGGGAANTGAKALTVRSLGRQPTRRRRGGGSIGCLLRVPGGA